MDLRVLCTFLLVIQTTLTYKGHWEEEMKEPFPEEEVSDEKRLLHDVFRRYRTLGLVGRPVKNSTHPVVVEFGLGLIKMELHERENMLSLSTWARYRWKDDYLKWDPNDYSGTMSIKVAPDWIWIPDIMLYNTSILKTWVRNFFDWIATRDPVPRDPVLTLPFLLGHPTFHTLQYAAFLKFNLKNCPKEPLSNHSHAAKHVVNRRRASLLKPR